MVFGLEQFHAFSGHGLNTLIPIADRYVPFTIEGLRMALPLENVERVVPAVEVTALPHAPGAVLGVINIRGLVIPVFDLRRRFNLPEKEVSPENKIIISNASKRTVAIVADDVAGVIEARQEDLAEPHEVLPELDHVKGVLKTGGGLIIIQDIDRFLSIEETEELDSALKPGENHGA